MQRNKKHRYFRKSREGRFLVVCAAASLCRTGTKVSDLPSDGRLWGCPLTVADRKLDFGAVRAAFDPCATSGRPVWAVADD